MREDGKKIFRIFLVIFLGTLIGARLGHVLFYQPDYYLVRPWKIFMIWQGGLASNGGFTGVLIALHLYCKKYKDMSFLELSDHLAIAALPAASLIRVGNFFNSEALGVPTNLPWAVKDAQIPFEQGMLLNMGQLLSIPFIVAGLVHFTYRGNMVVADRSILNAMIFGGCSVTVTLPDSCYLPCSKSTG